MKCVDLVTPSGEVVDYNQLNMVSPFQVCRRANACAKKVPIIIANVYFVFQATVGIWQFNMAASVEEDPLLM